MILEYHRPESIAAAMELLGRQQPLTVPLGGGTALNAPSDEQVAVVDLQGLALNRLERKGSALGMGATVTLQALLEAADLPVSLAKAVRHEAGYNLRQAATVAGTLVAADGRSPFAAALLALDAQLTLQPGDESLGLGDLLPLRSELLRGRLITRIDVSLQPALAYEYVARSPADRPSVCVAAARWPSGRTRVALGGHGAAPVLALDGPEADGALEAVDNAYSQAGDQWASAEYRVEAAKVLVQRCLQEIGQS